MSIILVRPSRVQVGRSANQSLNLTLANAGWTSGTIFTISGVSGATKVTQIVQSGGFAKVVITTTTATGSGTLTVSDGTNSGTTIVTQIAANRRKWHPGLLHSRWREEDPE